MTEQMRQDLASVTNQGFDNVPSPGDESRGSGAPISEDILRLQNATVNTSNTRIIPITEDASDITARLSRNTAKTVSNL